MKKQTLKEWLETCNCHSVSPCKIAIDGQEWEACIYLQEREYTKEMDCVRRWEKKVGDKYTDSAIYCIGELPRKYGKKKEKICFPFGASDWYVAGYALKENITPTNEEFHPFGESFILRPWNIPSEAIDKYEDKPYVRLPMVVK